MPLLLAQWETDYADTIRATRSFPPNRRLRGRGNYDGKVSVWGTASERYATGEEVQDIEADGGESHDRLATSRSGRKAGWIRNVHEAVGGC